MLNNIPKINLDNHYWKVTNNTTQVWSSASQSYVLVTDPTYVAWIAGGGPISLVDSEAILWTLTPNPALTTKMSSLQFMSLFTSAEQTAIATAAQTNASILLLMMSWSSATYIDLKDPRVKEGLDVLVTAEIITSARETAILSY
jgi:hypothetical protein